MKKFWKKYKGIIFIILSVLAFVLLSILVEVSRYQKIDKFKEGFVKDEYAVTVIALTSCSHCHNFSPVIKKLSKKYDLPLYWINIDAISNKDKDYMYGLFEPHGYEGASPYIAISNKGKVISNHTGEMDEESTISFLKNAGVIE